MADRDVIQGLIRRRGQSQDERAAAALGVHYADVDERTPEEMLRRARAFAAHVAFREASGTDVVATGDWRALFPDDAALADLAARAAAGGAPPHLALYLAFLELYQTPRALANELTGKHLDFQYRRVLGLEPKPALPDRAHVVFELKKGARPTAITPSQTLSAGKDAGGVELVYAPTTETVVNTSRVDSLRTIHVDRTGHGVVRFAPVANSADGLGAALPPTDPKWSAFGHAGLPAAEVGFAVASPLLRLAEGARVVTLRLALSGADTARLTNRALAGAFTAVLTGEKGWVEPESLAVTLAGGELRCEIRLPATAPAIVDYDAAVHGYRYAAAAPVVQLLLRGDPARVGYLDFAGAVVERASVQAAVDGVTSLALESDAGALDAKKPFLPFGTQPTVGSRFMVGYAEALAKPLAELRLRIRWKDVPSDLSKRYDWTSGVTNDTFTATVTFRDGEGATFRDAGVKLFSSSDATLERRLVLAPGTGGGARGSASTSTLGPSGLKVRALTMVGATWALREADRQVSAAPVLAEHRKPSRGTPTLVGGATAREGFVTFALDASFLHAEQRAAFVAAALKYGREGSGDPDLPADPYTPTVESISLGYTAASGDVAVSGASEAAFADPDLQFFHVTPFGPRREHGYQRARFPFLGGTDVPLLPAYPFDGELLVGLVDLAPGDSVSLLVQVADGSADPDLPRQPVAWSVLSDDYWRPLADTELALDTTNGLLASGIVRVVVPADATTTHAMLPADRIWLRAAVRRDVAAVSRLVDVAANGVEVRLVAGGHDAAHLDSALPAGRATKLKTPLAPVKAVAQPYASAGGRPAERAERFNTRVAERLRHKDRCVTAWDYERVVLEAFPNVHRVKCVPHARPDSWMAPGHVLLVVVPDLRNRNAVDPLQPRLDADTLARIEEHVRPRAGMQVQLHVKNPRYQKVRLDFKVRLRPGFEFNLYRAALEAEIVRTLSPWAFAPTRDLGFGGVVFRSVLLDVVEAVPYVDYVTDFKLFSYAGATVDTTDLVEARPATPDTILVSDAAHTIVPA